jgi:ubiquinone/menaquinone biosynthesis C-methylase UbiE
VSAPYVHGSTDAREIARLEKQARFVASWALAHFEAPPGARVLDLATGVGAMAGQLRAVREGLTLVGVDLSASQLWACRQNHPEVPVARADATRLPFPDRTFDRVHCTWLLEHVPSPVAVLREVRRVLEPEGKSFFVEVDNHTLLTHPPTPAVAALFAQQNAAQERALGDPYIGPKLEGYFREAGFTRIHARGLPLHTSAQTPALFEALVVEFAEIFEGLDESLPGAGAAMAAASRELRGLLTVPGAFVHYTPWLCTASP